MTRAKGILTGGRALTKWIQRNPTEGALLQRIITGVNTLAENTASSAVGRLSPPPPVNAINVKVSGEYAHVTLAHSGDIQQGVHYFVEAANNANFIGARPIHFGTSRTRDPIHLAANNDAGNPQNWYLRAYAQYPGSDPSEPVAYGGTQPTAITTTGTTALTWNPSTGSGTASGNGQQAGWGFGKILRRVGSGISTGTSNVAGGGTIAGGGGWTVNGV